MEFIDELDVKIKNQKLLMLLVEWREHNTMIEELQEILLDFVIFNFLSEKYYFVYIYIFVFVYLY